MLSTMTNLLRALLISSVMLSIAACGGSGSPDNSGASEGNGSGGNSSPSAINSAPIANNDSATAQVGQSVVIPVLANDVDDQPFPANPVTIDSSPNSGTATVLANGDIRFNAPESAGQITFSYFLSDSQGLNSTSARITVDVTPVPNNAPTANPDAAGTSAGMETVVAVLNNDSDSDGSLVAGSVELVAAATNGAAVVNADGSISYTPGTGFIGEDSFSYRVADNDGVFSSSAAVTVTVRAINQAPTAQDDSADALTAELKLIDVLVNDSDPEGAINRDSLEIVMAPSNGVASVVDGKIEYRSGANFAGEVTLSYRFADDAGELSDVATVTITVAPPAQEAPKAIDDDANIGFRASVGINVLANDTDANNDINRQSVKVLAQPDNATVEVQGDGSLRVTHTADTTDNISFEYEVADEEGSTSSATVVVEVGANQPPIGVADEIETVSGKTVRIFYYSNDSDPEEHRFDDSAATFSLVSDSANGSFTSRRFGDEPWYLSYTPNRDFTGEVQFSYVFEDEFGAESQPVTITVTVLPNDGTPVANDDRVFGSSNAGHRVVSLVQNDFDSETELDNSSVIITRQPENGTVTVDAGGNAKYVADEGHFGTDSFAYTVADDEGNRSDEAEVEVSERNPPGNTLIAVEDEASTTEATAVVIEVLANDTSNGDAVDPATVTFSQVPPLRGAIEVADDGTITYTPETGFAGVDEFYYQLLNEDGLRSSVVPVRVVVTSILSPAVMNGQVYIGPQADAAVEVFRVPDLTTAVHTTTTTSGGSLQEIGRFTIPSNLFADDDILVIRVTGESGLNYDSNVDGRLNVTRASPEVHAIADVASLRRGPFYLTTLSDWAFWNTQFFVNFSYTNEDILDQVDAISGQLMDRDITGDGVKNVADLLAWQPVYRSTDASGISSKRFSYRSQVQQDNFGSGFKRSKAKGVIDTRVPHHLGALNSFALGRNSFFQQGFFAINETAGALFLRDDSHHGTGRFGGVVSGDVEAFDIRGGVLFGADVQGDTLAVNTINIEEVTDGYQLDRILIDFSANKVTVDDGRDSHARVFLVDTALSGSTLYVSNPNGPLQIVDVSDLFDLKALNNIPAESAAVEIQVEGDRLIVATTDHVAIYDISEPTEPVRLSSKTFDSVTGIGLRDDILFVTANSRVYAQKVSATGVMTDLSSQKVGVFAEAITVDQNGRLHVMVGEYGTSAVVAGRILDFEEITGFVIRESYAIGGRTISGNRNSIITANLELLNDRVYIYTQAAVNKGVQVAFTEMAENPTFAITANNESFGRLIAPSDTNAVLTTAVSITQLVVGENDEAMDAGPADSSGLLTSSSESVKAIAHDGRYAIVGHRNGDLFVYDTNAGQVTLTDSLALNYMSIAGGGGYFVVIGAASSDERRKLKVYVVDNDGQLQLNNEFVSDKYLFTSVEMDGSEGIALGTFNQEGRQAVRFSVSANGEITMSETHQAFTPSGNQAFGGPAFHQNFVIAESGTELFYADSANPSPPAPGSVTPWASERNGGGVAAYKNGIMFLSQPSSGVQAWNISDHENPVFYGFAMTPTLSGAFWFNGTRQWVSDEYAGLVKLTDKRAEVLP